MAGQIRLFEKTAAGLLVEVDPANAEAVRAGRRVSVMNMSAEVLWTAEEEAEREIEIVNSASNHEAAASAKEKASADRTSGKLKLKEMGLSDDEIAALLR